MKNRLAFNGDLVKVKGHHLHIYRQGDTDKPKLVLMSGSGTVAPVYDFKILCEKLVRDFRVIVIEKFGYGYSDICDFPSDVDTLVTIQKEALEKLGESGPYMLMPHSMSGIEALRWIQLYPDNVTALIGNDMTTPLTYRIWTKKRWKRKSS